MIKVLHVTGTMNLGGQETFIMNFFRNIDRANVKFDFLCLGNGKYHFAEEISALGGEIFHLKKTIFDRIPLYKLFTRKSLTKRFLHCHKYDVVHIHTANAISYLMAKGALEAGVRKVIVHSHNTSSYGSGIHKFYKKRLSALNIVKVACSRQAAEWLFEPPYSQVKVIYNAFDLGKFAFDAKKRIELRDAYGIKEMLAFGHVGRIDKQKNQKFLIDLMCEYIKINNQAILFLVGKGDQRKKLEKYAKNLNIEGKIVFLGIKPDVSDLYNMFDVFLFPSLFEGLGIVSVEAQANALPVVQSPGVPRLSVISDKVLYNEINKSSVLAWIESIHQLVKNDRKSFTPTENYGNYNIFSQVKELLAIYEEQKND